MNDLLKDDDPGAKNSLDFPVEVVFYSATFVTLVMIFAMMMKFLGNCVDHGGGDEARPTETSGLLWSKGEGALYGTNEEEDIEKVSRDSWSDELYDGKICVICYDHQRSCFFIPCGHCVTCYTCTNRIIGEESKGCPICRASIDKVRMFDIL